MNTVRTVVLSTVIVAISAVAISRYGVMSLDAADPKDSPNGPRAVGGRQPAAGEKQVAQPAAARPVDEDSKKRQVAIFAGGCFWCTEFAFEQLAGVIDVESGYSGGTKATANYEAVHRGGTAHAEAIRITFDPNTISFDQLLDAFFDAHDPTQLNRQGKDDIGRQYRSAIFYVDEDQKKQAEAKIADLEAKQVYKKKKIMTKLEPFKEFYPAEDYHQDFARRNPGSPYIQTHALPKAMHVRSKHPDLLRSNN